MATVEGIDVSNWQGKFDWSAWKNRIGFGMAKATEGAGLVDAEFEANWDAMWWLRPDHRLPRFAYAFFRAGQDPDEQAYHLVETVKKCGLLPGDNFVLDCEETVSGSGENDGISAARCAPLAVRCLRKVNDLAPGHRVCPYLNPDWARRGGSAGMASWFLWLAEYGVSQPQVPPPWNRWTFWQNGDDPLDADVYNGDEASLLAFTRMPDRR